MKIHPRIIPARRYGIPIARSPAVRLTSSNLGRPPEVRPKSMFRSIITPRAAEIAIPYISILFPFPELSPPERMFSSSSSAAEKNPNRGE